MNDNVVTGLMAIAGVLLIIAFIVWYMISEDKAKKKRMADYEAERRKIEQDKINADNAYRKDQAEKREIELQKRKDRLNFIYGSDLGERLFNEKFFIGMTKEQLMDSKNGKPDNIETEVMKTKTKETWVYGNKSSGDVFVFENDLLTKFKDR